MKTVPEPKAQPSPEDILDELRSLVTEAEKILDANADNAAPGLDENLAALRDRFEDARDRVTEALAKTRRKVAAGAREADEMIRDNPYQSLAIAAGVGLLLGLLLSRRRD